MNVLLFSTISKEHLTTEQLDINISAYYATVMSYIQLNVTLEDGIIGRNIYIEKFSGFVLVIF